MLAHLYLDFLDPNNIASLSSAVVSYLKRARGGYFNNYLMI
jgi:hypothetical protein